MKPPSFILEVKEINAATLSLLPKAEIIKGGGSQLTFMQHLAKYSK